MENIENNKNKEDQELPSKEKPQEKLRKDIIQSFGTVDNPFDTSRTITMRPNKEGGLTISQRKMNITNDQMETLTKLQGKLTPEELTKVLEKKHPEIALKDTSAIISPEDVKKYFKKLSIKEQKEYISGLDEAISGANSMMKYYEELLEKKGLTEKEKNEVKNDLMEQKEELEYIEKLRQNLLNVVKKADITA